MKKKIINTSLIILLDRIIKLLIINNIIVNTSKTIVTSFFYLTNVHNVGAAWSILSGQQIFLILVALVVSTVIIYYLVKNPQLSKIELSGFILLLGGTIGNLVDRIIYGYVIDYLQFYLGNYSFPIFNFSDIAIVGGVVILIIKNLGGDQNGINCQ